MKTPVKLIVGLAVTTVVLVAADPILGTWKMNVSKSKINPGAAPQSVTAVYSQEGDWIVIKTNGIDSAGKPISRTNRVKRDGAEYPYEGPYGKGTISVKRIDDYNSESVTKFSGGHAVNTRTVISKDGKTRTQTSRGTNAKGERVNSVAVFEKQ